MSRPGPHRARLLPLLALLLLAAALPDSPRAASPPHAGHFLTAARLLERGVVPVQAPACTATLGVQLLDCAPQSAPASESEGAQPPLTLHARWLVPTPRFFAALAAHEEGGLVRVHGFGDVALQRPDGETAWFRPSMSFYDEWQLAPWIVPFVFVGASPVNPWTLASERPFAVGDLTGDGVDDVTVGHFVRLRDVGAQGKVTTRNLSVVTVLDGRDGRTRWSRQFPGYVTQLLVQDRLLVIGNETGDVRGTERQGEAGSTTTLHALRFEPSERQLTAGPAWTVTTGAQWARWLAVAPTSADALAASWTDKQLGDGGRSGHVLLVDLASGDVRWQRELEGYPRALRYDAGREVVVVHEQADPLSGGTGPDDVRFDYRLVGLAAASGTAVTVVDRPNALLTALAVGDVSADGAAEWVAADVETTALPTNVLRLPEYTVAARTQVFDGGDGRMRWSQRDAATDNEGVGDLSVPVVYGVLPVPGAVLAAGFAGADTQLRALSGGDGQVRWSRRGDIAFPLYLVPAVVRGRPAVLSATGTHVLRAHALDSGAPLLEVPLLGDVFAAEAADVDGDATSDLLVGGESGAVFALDGGALGPMPAVLWRTRVAGPVHQLVLADVTDDHGRELVAAATKAVHVLRLADGAELTRLDFDDDFVWTVTAGDVDGDADEDVIVPTRSLAAFTGTGEKLWEYRPLVGVNTYFSSTVLTPSGHVAAQFVCRQSPLCTSRHHQVVVALDSATGAVAWSQVQAGYTHIPRLWRSVTVLPDEGAGPKLAFTFDAKQSQQPVLSGWHPRTDVYDDASGTLQSTTQLREGVVHMGTRWLDGTGLVTYNWANVARIDASDVLEVRFPTAVSDAEVADFGPLGRRFVTAWSKVHVFDAAAPSRLPDGHEHEPETSWATLFSGDMLVRDLDGDGSDELVVHPFNWNGYATVATFEGTGVGHMDLLPHGIAVLSAHG